MEPLPTYTEDGRSVPKEKLPWTKFEPRAWLAEPGLRMCSLAARGLWMDLLCLMWDADRRGYLQLNGHSPTPDAIARLTGASPAEVSRLLQELEDSGVLSRDTSEVIYSRRMVREERERNSTRERVSRHRTGKPGRTPKEGAAPTVTSGPCNGTSNAPCNGDVTPQNKRKEEDKEFPPKPPRKRGSGRGVGEVEEPRPLASLQRRLDRDRRLAVAGQENP